jgi:MFS family permease
MAKGHGISAAGMGLGMGLGILLSAQIAAEWGWRYVFIIYAIPCFLAFSMILITIKEPERPQGASVLKWEQFIIAFTSNSLWFFYIAGFCNMYMLWVLGAWAPTIFLEQGIGNLVESGIYTSLIGFVAIPSLILSGIVGDLVNRKGYNECFLLLVCLAAASISSAISGMFLTSDLDTRWLLTMMIICSFLVWSFFPPFFALLSKLAHPRIVGTTFGVANTVAFVSSLLAPWSTGYVRDQTHSFAWGFYLASIVLLLGFLSLLLVSSSIGRQSNKLK